jgi:hypothetical protein
MSIYGSDGYLQSRAVPVLLPAQLARLGTRELLGRLNKLRKCIDSLTDTEYDEEDATLVEGIVFKDSPEWKRAYADVRLVLTTREHVPRGPEKTRARKGRALRNKTSERRPAKRPR